MLNFNLSASRGAQDHDGSTFDGTSFSPIRNARTMLCRLATSRRVRQISSSLLEDSTSRTLDDSRSSCFSSDGRLQNVSSTQAPAPLHRKELELGEVLGKGGFSLVSALEGFKMKVGETCFLPEADCVARRKLERNRGSFAVKHLSRGLLKKPSQFKQAAIDLEREARLLGQLNHPHIIRLRGIAVGGIATALASGNYKDYFMVMDRLCETLDVRIRRWNLEGNAPPPFEKLKYGRDLASALNYLHEQRLIFRDVKPQNIGFRKDAAGRDQLQLFDFGLCRALPEETESSFKKDLKFHLSVAGTPRYMCPEMLRGEPYGVKADVYSWAICLHEILSQEKPFGHLLKTHYLTECIGHGHCRPPLDVLSQVPKVVLHLLAQSWADSAQERPSMAGVYYQCSSILIGMRLSPPSPTSGGSNKTNMSMIEEVVEYVNNDTRGAGVRQDNGMKFVEMNQDFWRRHQSSFSSMVSQDHPSSFTSIVLQDAGADVPLPEGWTEHFDSSRGEYYYHNAADGTSTWERPEVTVSAPAIPEEVVFHYVDEDQWEWGDDQDEVVVEQVVCSRRRSRFAIAPSEVGIGIGIGAGST